MPTAHEVARIIRAPSHNGGPRSRSLNRWKNPEWLEREVIARDRCCIYCRVTFEPIEKSRGFRPTWEHIVNDAKIITRRNIARCCASCNASKGAKKLSDWLTSDYCKQRRITRSSVAPIVKCALR
jgi:hypothetical protein